MTDIKNFKERMAKAISSISQPKKDTRGGGGARQYNYATLQSVIEVINKSLHENNLYFTQTSDSSKIITTIHDQLSDTNQFFDFYMPPTPLIGKLNDKVGFTAQDYGGYITYMRRYALCMAFALYGEEDDDGARASGIDTKKTTAI